jgi:hypothetical protein
MIDFKEDMKESVKEAKEIAQKVFGVAIIIGLTALFIGAVCYK